MLTAFLLSLLLVNFTSGFNYQRRGRDWPGTCATGLAQSPINLEDDSDALQEVHPGTSKYTPLRLLYQPATKVVTESGHGTIKTTSVVGSFEGTLIGESKPKSFQFSNFHFHAYSEHQVNQHIFQLEMHIVHTFSEGLAVLGVFFQPGEQESKILSAIITEGSLNLTSALGEEITDFYFYKGSLTTPPCSETVNWFVAQTPLEATDSQIAYFRDRWMGDKAFAGGNGNNRAIQARNGRVVYRFNKT